MKGYSLIREQGGGQGLQAPHDPIRSSEHQFKQQEDSRSLLEWL